MKQLGINKPHIFKGNTKWFVRYGREEEKGEIEAGKLVTLTYSTTMELYLFDEFNKAVAYAKAIMKGVRQ